MMFAVARVKRAETAFPCLHGAVEVVTRGRHVEQLRGREHLAIPRHARPMALAVAVRLPRLHGPLDERLAENERKQAEKQAEPDMEETWDLSDPADPLNIGMGWGTGGHGLGL